MFCYIISENIVWCGKGLVLISVRNICLVGSNAPSSIKTNIFETFSFRHHINKLHTQKSTSLLLNATIFSQTGLQFCVATLLVHSWQTDFHGLHERLPWLVWHSRLILVIRLRSEKYSSYIMVQWTSHPASKCVFSNRQHCNLSACSPTTWVLDYTKGTEVMFLMTLLYPLIKTATNTEAMFAILDIREW